MSSPGSYGFLEFNAPMSNARADSIARSLILTRPEVVLDLGCGWGELLLRIVAADAACRGIGLDADEGLIERATRNAHDRGLADRVDFRVGDASDPSGTADVVVCVGADHAFGDQADALRALRSRVRPGGRLLFGTGFWEQRASDEQAAAVGLTPGSLVGLPDLIELTIACGFRPLRIETANRDEWQAFESGFLADAEEWLVDHLADPQAETVRAGSDVHRNEWLRGYAGVLGFAYLTLGPG